MVDASDEALLQRWHKGDREAGERLIEAHFDALARFFWGKLDEASVADAVQRTFLACIEQRERLGDHVSFRPFLFGIARNVLRMQARKAHRHARAMGRLQAYAHPPTGGSTELDRRTKKQLLLAALSSLSIDDQLALQLFYWEDMRAVDVAAVLGVPEGTAKTRIRSAKTKLAREINRCAGRDGLGEASVAEFARWADEIREMAAKARG